MNEGWKTRLSSSVSEARKLETENGIASQGHVANRPVRTKDAVSKKCHTLRRGQMHQDVITLNFPDEGTIITYTLSIESSDSVLTKTLETSLDPLPMIHGEFAETTVADTKRGQEWYATEMADSLGSSCLFLQVPNQSFGDLDGQQGVLHREVLVLLGEHDVVVALQDDTDGRVLERAGRA